MGRRKQKLSVAAKSGSSKPRSRNNRHLAASRFTFGPHLKSVLIIVLAIINVFVISRTEQAQLYRWLPGAAQLQSLANDTAATAATATTAATAATNAVATTQPIREERQYGGLAITTAFNHRKDILFANRIRRPNLLFIKAWYESVHKYPHIRGVVFNTMYKPWFVEKHTTKQVEFIQVKLQGPIHHKVQHKSLNDQRFFHIQDYLEQRLKNASLTSADPLEYVLLTDSRDVEFFRNPFEFMIKTDEMMQGNHQLFVGSEFEPPQQGREWQNAIWQSCFKQNFTHWLFLNCGIMGGHISVVLPLIREMTQLMSVAPYLFCDQASLQKIIMEQYAEKIVTGYPLHARFRAEQMANETLAYIRHK